MWNPIALDTHTLGEPTRVVLEPPPALLALPAQERFAALGGDLLPLVRTVVGEPRTSDAAVAAFILPPEDPQHRAWISFANDVGGLRMCVHGMIGVGRALAHRGALEPGTHTFETAAGLVRLTLLDPDHSEAERRGGSIEIENVASRRTAENVPIVTSGGPLRGDIAYGGNWFFILDPSPIPIVRENLDPLYALTREVRLALIESGISGDDGSEIDHVALFEPRDRGEQGSDARNFVLCPGGAHDRSPCGTGTSAWLARLHVRGRLPVGESRVVESVIGSRFVGRVAVTDEGAIVPTIRGEAAVVAEVKLYFDERDPYLGGIPRSS